MIANNMQVGVIVDANNLIHKRFAAGGLRHCVDDFIRQLGTIESALNPKPSWLICAFDSKESFRKNIDPEYKANRSEKPPELREALRDAWRRAMDAGWLVACEEGYEADDVLASCAAYLVRTGHKALLVANDKDLNQCLVNGRVSIANKVTVKGEFEFFTAEDLKNKLDLRPDQWIDFQTMIGDSTDNIKGIEGIGSKIATRLLNKVGPLEKILANPAVASTKRLTDNLVKFEKRASDVRSLVKLETDLPVAYLFK